MSTLFSLPFFKLPLNQAHIVTSQTYRLKLNHLMRRFNSFTFHFLMRAQLNPDLYSEMYFNGIMRRAKSSSRYQEMKQRSYCKQSKQIRVHPLFMQSDLSGLSKRLLQLVLVCLQLVSKECCPYLVVCVSGVISQTLAVYVIHVAKSYFADLVYPVNVL